MCKSTEIITYKTPDNQTIQFPVAKIKGRNPGPKILIAAGLHGCEYPGIVAAIRLFKSLEPSDVCGEITIVTLCSIAAFESRSFFVNPADGKNPNRVFPGSLNGSYTDIMAFHLFHDFICKAEYYLDLHGGDLVEDLIPFTLFHGGEDNEITQQSRKLAKVYGLPHVVMTREDGLWKDSGTTYGTAARAGIPCIIAESGGGGRLEEDAVMNHIQGLNNVLCYLGCIKGLPKIVTGQQFYPDFAWLTAPVSGIFYTKVKVGDALQEGQNVGCIENYFGEHLADVLSPYSGRLLFSTISIAASAGGVLMGIGIQ